MVEEKALGTMLQELSRGTVTMAVLLTTEQPTYGYSLVNALQDAGLEVEQNTLYPLLRRLESQGLLESSWDTSESRPRKYYQLTEEGRRIGNLLGVEWKRLNRVLNALLESKKEEDQ